MLIGLADRLAQLYPQHRRCRRRFVAQFRAAPPVPAQQMVFRRALRRPVRAPGVLARPLLLEARRRRHDRPLRPAWRRLAVGVGNRVTAPAAVGLSLYLCAGDAARPRRRRDLGDGGCPDERRFPHPFADAGACRWSPRIACLFAGDRRRALDRARSRRWSTFALGIVLWAQFDIGGAQWQFIEHAPTVRRASPGRSASTASR